MCHQNHDVFFKGVQRIGCFCAERNTDENQACKLKSTKTVNKKNLLWICIRNNKYY